MTTTKPNKHGLVEPKKLIRYWHKGGTQRDLYLDPATGRFWFVLDGEFAHFDDHCAKKPLTLDDVLKGNFELAAEYEF